jgi:putative transposase
MAQSLSKVYVHLVFSTKFRKKIILPDIETELFKVISGNIKSMNGIALSINGTRDHIHILTLFPRTISMAHFVNKIKTGSTKWIRNKNRDFNDFSWQNGYAVFSVGEKDIKTVKAYIENQKQHHSKVKFKGELIGILKGNKFDYNEEYLWD